jgi:hypothetical protein
LFTTEYGGRARRDHDFDIALRGDRCGSGRAVIRAVSRHLGNSDFNLIEQRRNLRRIVDVLIREGPRYYHAVAGIDRQTDFAPSVMTDAIRPSVCRNPSLNAVRTISVVWIAASLYRAWPLARWFANAPVPRPRSIRSGCRADAAPPRIPTSSAP